MFIYVNTLFYVVALLSFVVLVLFLIVVKVFASTLTMLMLLIVYTGAMMILIGYVCAVSPNLIVVSSSYSPLFLLFLVFPLLYGLDPSNEISLDVPSNFLISSYGWQLFLLLAFMLFITLLMVTSQYLAPKGPFRAVSL